MTNKILCILLIGFCFLQSCAENKAENKEDMAKKAGAEVYQTNCAVCHSGAISEAPKLASLKLLNLLAGRARLIVSWYADRIYSRIVALMAAGRSSICCPCPSSVTIHRPWKSLLLRLLSVTQRGPR